MDGGFRIGEDARSSLNFEESKVSKVSTISRRTDNVCCGAAVAVEDGHDSPILQSHFEAHELGLQSFILTMSSCQSIKTSIGRVLFMRSHIKSYTPSALP